MNTSTFQEMTVGDLIGQIVRENKKKSGTPTPEFLAYVAEQEIPEIISKIGLRLTAKRLLKLEGKFLNQEKKPASKRSPKGGAGTEPAQEEGQS